MKKTRSRKSRDTVPLRERRGDVATMDVLAGGWGGASSDYSNRI
jgi:hypothetical protein